MLVETLRDFTVAVEVQSDLGDVDRAVAVDRSGERCRAAIALAGCVGIGVRRQEGIIAVARRVGDGEGAVAESIPKPIF